MAVTAAMAAAAVTVGIAAAEDVITAAGATAAAVGGGAAAVVAAAAAVGAGAGAAAAGAAVAAVVGACAPAVWSFVGDRRPSSWAPWVHLHAPSGAGLDAGDILRHSPLQLTPEPTLLRCEISHIAAR